MSIYKTSCPSCGQRDVRDPDGQGPIFDHNGPDGRECSVSDIDWNGAITLHPVAPVGRCSYVGTDSLRQSMQEADERIAAAERECDQLRAERDQALALLRAVDAELADPKAALRRITEARYLIASGLLDDEGQQR